MILTPKYELIQERLGKPLDEQLRTWRGAGIDAEAIARIIGLETRVKVTGETIRAWLRSLNGHAA